MIDTRTQAWDYFKLHTLGVSMIFVASLPLIFVSSLVGVPFLPQVSFAAVSLVIMLLLKRIMDTVHWILVQPVSSALDYKGAETKYKEAETEAIREHGIVQQFNTRGHAKVTVQNAPSINQTQETVRIVPMRTPNRLVDDIDETDLAAFIDRMFVVGHSVRALMGYTLPSGKKIDTFEELNKHMAPLLKTSIIRDRSERKKGYLTVTSATEAKQLLGLPADREVKNI